jgi:hypothetical protein
LPVFRPWWAISRKVWSSIRPQPRWYKGRGTRMAASARRPG